MNKLNISYNAVKPNNYHIFGKNQDMKKMEVGNLFHLLNNSYLLYMNYSHTVIIKVLMLSITITINEWQIIIKDYIVVTIDALFEMRFF